MNPRDNQGDSTHLPLFAVLRLLWPGSSVLCGCEFLEGF